MILSFPRARVYLLTKDTFESKLPFLMNRIEFDYICLKLRYFPSYQETTYVNILTNLLLLI